MWTTGTASGGSSEGLGGTPAQVSKTCVLLPRPQYSFLLMRSVFVAGASDETKPLVKSVRSSLPTVYPNLIKRHDWPVKMFNWQIRLKGNSKLFSGNSLGPLRA